MEPLLGHRVVTLCPWGKRLPPWAFGSQRRETLEMATQLPHRDSSAPQWGSGPGLSLYRSGASSEPMVVTVRPDQGGTSQAGLWGQYQLLEPRLQSEPRSGWGVKAQHWSWLCGHRRNAPLWAPSHENSTIPMAPLTSPIPDSQGQEPRTLWPHGRGSEMTRPLRAGL